MEDFPEFLGNWLVASPVLSPPMKSHVTAKSRPNKNILIATYRHCITRKDMQQIITAKLKLTTTPAQFQALRETQLAYRAALNAVSRYGFEQDKTSNVTRLHKGMY